MLATFWITSSEFVRNEFLLKNYWVRHFNNLNLKFETLPLNGVLWALWALILCLIIHKLLSKFTFVESVVISWVAMFPAMWITTFNLQVLPIDLLIFALPLSILEVVVAAFILKTSKKL